MRYIHQCLTFSTSPRRGF